MEALVRELREELGVTVNVQDCFPVNFSTIEEKKMHLLLLLYTVRRWTGTPSCVEGQPGLAWVTPEELGVRYADALLALFSLMLYRRLRSSRCRRWTSPCFPRCARR